MIYRFTASLLTVLVMAAGAASAQSSSTSGPALTVEELKTCLCQEPQLEAMRKEVATRRAMLDERQAQLGMLESQIIERRKTLDPNDVIGQELLKNSMAQAAALRDLIQSDTRPALNQSVAEYNNLAASYTEICVNRPRYAYDVDQAKQNLVCPLP